MLCLLKRFDLVFSVRMKVLVTGGAGFIGGHITEQLATKGHDVTIIDNHVPYYDLGIKEHNVESAREAASAAGGSYELVEDSITDEQTVDKLVADVDVVYHQAAQAGVRKSIEQPKKVNHYNVNGTVEILEAARKHNVERVVVASSSSVYGKPEYLPYDEDHPTTPVSPYGVSKLATEQYARTYSEVYGLPTVSLRYFTVYGPRMRPNMAITNFVSRCLHGEPPVVFGSGEQTRDFTYVTDIRRVNEQLLTDDSADGEIMNVGSTDNIDIQTLAKVIRDEINPSLNIVYDDPRKGDAEHTHADVSKANELLGYEPTINIREGVRKFIDWYRENEDWYDQLVRNS
jgi:UDP-glucose 4-epimerase